VQADLHRAGDQVTHLRAQVRALSPLSTLERGYAVVQHADGRIVMDRADVDVDELLRVRVARGDFGVRPVTEQP
jgi:Exonuclease VII, large subunit